MAFWMWQWGGTALLARTALTASASRGRKDRANYNSYVLCDCGFTSFLCLKCLFRVPTLGGLKMVERGRELPSKMYPFTRHFLI